MLVLKVWSFAEETRYSKKTPGMMVLGFHSSGPADWRKLTEAFERIASNYRERRI